MTPLRFAWCLTCLFLGSLVQKTDLKSPVNVHPANGFYSANVGDNVTLQCFYNGYAVMLYWYKQTLGQKPEVMTNFYKHEESGTFHDEFKDISRFTLDIGNTKNHLTISNLRISDSATYYCISVYEYDFEFVEGITVSVKGSGLNIKASVHQSESIQPAGSVTLNCTVHTGTCDGEHSIYWFKESEESHPGLIYTDGGSNDQCERKPNTQTHTCMYNLPMKSLNLSHAGIYYCAVASCGRILFGNGKKFHLEDEGHSHVLVYFLSGALTFTTILVVFLAFSLYKIIKKNNCQWTGSQARSAAASTPNAEDYQDSEDLHYAALREHTLHRSTRHRDHTHSDCVYTSVMQ